MAELTKLNRLLVSKSGQTAGNFKTATFALIGVYLLGMAAWRYFAHGITDNAGYSLIIGIASLFAMKYQKIIYISPLGPAKETHTWVTHHREVLKWNEIKFITLMHKGSATMVFLERDVVGWKILFEKSQSEELKKIFDKYIPDVEVNEITR